MEGTIPPVIGGRYRTIRLIGRGAMGAVYEVEHLHTGQHLALKVLLQTSRGEPEAIARFKREARASSQIKSEHVVRVTDADVAPELGGAPFLVMELLEGASLEVVAGPKVSEALTWLRQIARALDKAHALGIVHRDLKPENLFLAARDDGTPLVKVLDFGLAKFVADEASSTQSGQVLGTPLYMSPEQADSHGVAIGPQSDLFSFGLIAFRLLVGREYWGAGSIKQILTRVLLDPMEPASARGSLLGPGFDTWFARACSRECAGRFTSAHEQVEALAEALDEALDLPTIAPPADSDPRRSPRIGGLPRAEAAPTLGASVTSATAPRSGRGRSTIVVGAVIASAAGAALWLAARSPSQPVRGAAMGIDAPVMSVAAPAASSAAPRLPASAIASVSPAAPSAAAPAPPLGPSDAPSVVSGVQGVRRPLPAPKPAASAKAPSATPAAPSGLPVDPLAGQN